MATATSGSSNVSSLDSKITASLCTGKITIDLSPSVFIGSGVLSMLGASVRVTNPLGVVIKEYLTSGYDFDNSDSPPLQEIVEVSIPTMAGNYQYGNYTIEVELFETEALSWKVTKTVYVDYPNPKNKSKNYGTVGATIKGLCRDGKALIQVDNVPTYRNELVESQVNDFTLRFPTASVDDITTDMTSFSVVLFEGIYEINGEICATYNLGDNVYAEVKYKLCYEKKLACIIDECCVLEHLKTLHDRLESDCSDEEKQTTSAIVIDALRLLKSAELAQEYNEDASDYLTALEALLGCSCTGDCADGVPVSSAIPSTDYLMQGCGFQTETVGNTKIYTLNNYSYEISVNSNNLVEVGTPTLNGCVWTIPINSKSIGVKTQAYFDDAGVGTFTDVGVIRSGNVLLGLIDDYTEETVTFSKITGVDDTDIDGVIIRKKGSEYFSRNYTDDIDVRWFGATGNGTTNDTLAIQAAIDYAGGLGGSIVYMPEGTYMVGSAITLITGVTLKGSGQNSTIIKPSVNNISAIKVYGQRRTGVEALQVNQNGKIGIVGIDYTGDPTHESISANIKDVLVNGCVYGLKSAYTYFVTVQNFQAKDAEYSFLLGSASNSWAFVGCSFFSTVKGGDIINSAGVSFNGCTFEYRSAVELFNCDGTSFTGNYFENMEDPITQYYWIVLGTGGVTTRGVIIAGNNFNHGAFYSLWCAKVEGLSVHGNTFRAKLYAIAFDQEGDNKKNNIDIGSNVYQIDNLPHDLSKAVRILGVASTAISTNISKEVVQPYRFYSSPEEPLDSLVYPNSSIIYQYGDGLFLKQNKAGVISRRSIGGINGVGSSNFFMKYDEFDTAKPSTMFDEGTVVTIVDRAFKVRTSTIDQEAIIFIPFNITFGASEISCGTATGVHPLLINRLGGNVLIRKTTDTGEELQVGGEGHFEGTVIGADAINNNHFVTKLQLDNKKAAAQADSTAVSVADLATDFNALLAKLRAAGILAI